MVSLYVLETHTQDHNPSSTAQSDDFQPEKEYDYASAPETLLHDATCSPKTDTWMLGCMVSAEDGDHSSLAKNH